MSRIVSFSVDDDFAAQLDRMAKNSGYRNRSKFLRDASLAYADASRRDDLSNMEDDAVTEGTLVIYYQHGVESKLTELRHAHSLAVTSYNHNCLTVSHTCVDTMQVNGSVGMLRTVVESLKNTLGIDRVTFVAAPKRDEGCC